MLSLIALRPILLMQVLVILATVIDLISGRLQLPSRKQPWWIIMTGLFAGIVFSHAGNFYIGGAIFAFSEFGKTYLTFIVIWINLNTTKRILIFSTLLVIMGTFIAVHCILVSQTGSGFGGGGAMKRGDAVGITQAQFYGIFSDPNDTAQILVLVIPLCVLIMIRYKAVFKIIPAGIIITLVWGVIATQSRGGFISMGITFFVALRSFFRPLHFAMILIVGAAAFPVLAPARLSGGMVDESSSSRVAFWGEGTQAFISKNPLFGVGFKSIHDHTSSGHTVHNSYVEAYTELGAFGYIFWFSATVFAIYSMVRLSKTLPENNEEKSLVNWIKCIIPGLAGIYAAGFFLSRAYTVPTYVVFAMIAACYNIISQKVGVISVNQYCNIDPKQWIKWISLAWLNIIFIYILIRILNLVI